VAGDTVDEKPSTTLPLPMGWSGGFLLSLTRKMRRTTNGRSVTSCGEARVNSLARVSTSKGRPFKANGFSPVAAVSAAPLGYAIWNGSSPERKHQKSVATRSGVTRSAKRFQGASGADVVRGRFHCEDSPRVLLPDTATSRLQ
jgi:hypothetical protein